MYSASWNVGACATLSGAAPSCTVTGFLESGAVGASSDFIGSPTVPGSAAPATFASAFNAWNGANGGQWTLVDAGSQFASLGVTLNAYVGLNATQISGINVAGGLSPVVFTVNGGSADVLSSLVWTQALVVNFTPLLGALAQPIQTLDTFDLSQDAAGDNPGFPTACAPASSGASPAGGADCGPIYPFQYGDTLDGYAIAVGGGIVPLGVDPFVDGPMGNWPNASFEAITLLSSVDPDTHTLAVYGGFAYGFTLSVPEPSTWALLLMALPALAFGRRWKGFRA